MPTPASNEITVYTWANCPYCIRTKDLLKRKGLPFNEVNLDGKDAEVDALRERTGYRTIPQIFIGEEFIGGFTELATLDSSGKLDQMTKR